MRCLEKEGVRHVFGIPGEETLALNAALVAVPVDHRENARLGEAL